METGLFTWTTGHAPIPYIKLERSAGYPARLPAEAFETDEYLLITSAEGREPDPNFDSHYWGVLTEVGRLTQDDLYVLPTKS